MVVKENMKVMGFHDFYSRCDIIKAQFMTLSNDARDVYKYYIYSNRLIPEYVVDKMWEFLIHDKYDPYYISKKQLSTFLCKTKI